MIQKNNTDCYTDDWKRTEPDHVVYLPKTENGSDGYADHFVVAVTPGGALLAMWTQSAAEGTRDSRVVFSHSLDGGESWTGPQLLAGTENGRGVPAMFGFPVMSPGGRIYCLYNKHKSIVDLGFRITAVLGCHYSTTMTAACMAAWGRGICGVAVPCSWPLVNFDRTEVNPYGSVSPSNSPIPMEWVLDRSRWSGWPCMPV